MITGSLQIKNNKYYAVLNLKANGKRKAKWIFTGYTVKGNKTRASAVLEELKREYSLKEELVSPDTLFCDYIRHWLNDKKSEIDEITYQSYHQYVYKHLLPFYEKKSLKLCDVKASDIQKYIDKAKSSGKLNGKGGLSRRSIKLHITVLIQVFNKAIEQNLLHINPCNSVKLPPEKERKIKFMAQNQINNFLDCIKDEFIYPIILFAIFYGMRRSEILGLKWENISLSEKRFTIESTVVKVEKTICKDKTKNESSHRTYPIIEDIYKLLLNIKKTQETNRQLFGNQYVESPYVFTWPDGRPVSIDFVSHKFPKLLKEHGFEHMRFHDLRHSCASLMLSKGYALKDVQEWLGHTNIDTTADIYGHLDISRKTQISDSLKDIFS